MKQVLSFLLLCCIVLQGFAQTVVNSLSEVAALNEGTSVKLMLNDVHTTAYYYDFWYGIGYLFLQDETTAIRFQGGIGELRGGKTLNGYVLAKTLNGGLVATSDTNEANITSTDWNYAGLPASLADVAAGKCDNKLVEINNLTSAPTNESMYYIYLTQAGTTIKLYEELGVPNFYFSDVPTNIKSITGLIMNDGYESYMAVVSKDLIIEDKGEEIIEGATLIKSFAELKNMAEDELVYVRLTNAHVTAEGVNQNSQSFVTYLQDATAGVMLVDAPDSIVSGKTLNGGLYATTIEVGGVMSLVANEYTTDETLEVSPWDYSGIPTVTISDLLAGKNPYMLVEVNNVEAADMDGSGKIYMLRNKLGHQVPLYDEITGELANLPKYFKSIRVLNLYASHLDIPYYACYTGPESYVVGSVEDFNQGDGSPEPLVTEVSTIADLKKIPNDVDFTWHVDSAIVTLSLYDSDSQTYSAIIEDKTGALTATGLPFKVEVSTALVGTIYGTVDYEENYIGFRTKPSAKTHLCSVSSIPVEIVPTKLSIAEAKSSRYHSCLVELEDLSCYDGSWNFMGFEQSCKVLNDGSSTILSEDGWEVYPENYQYPSTIKSFTGFIQMFYGYLFIYPFDENSIVDANDVNSIETNRQQNAPQTTYTLEGLQVHTGTQHGIFIMNGKKIIK